jgi:hypothetical protein
MSERPRFVITCDGTKGQRHELQIVRIYARDHDGTWLPILTAVRDGKDVFLPAAPDYVLPRAGDIAQYYWPCQNRHCPYEFRADAAKVNRLMDQLLEAGLHEAPLRFIDKALRRAD